MWKSLLKVCYYYAGVLAFAQVPVENGLK